MVKTNRGGLLRDFIAELKRRNVIRVSVAYVVVAWLLAQVADLALENFGAPDWVIKTVLFLLALGFPLAVFFAWAFELTPEGIKKEQNVERSQSITAHTGRKLDFLIIGVLAIAVGFLLYDKFGGGAPDVPASEEVAEAGVPVSAEKSIAVLPFVDMSAEQNQEYLSDGIAEELLNVLVKIRGLKVASRTSSFAFKGKDAGIPEIAEILKVGHVLEGSVRKADERVRITAQLIDVKSDRHLWSETYDRDLKDIFAIQDEIAGEIVEALKVTLGAGEEEAIHDQTAGTQNLEAYQLYLRGRALWQRRGGDNIRKAIDLLEQALELDPGFARGWSALASANLTLPTYSGDASFAVHGPIAEQAARKALSIDPTIAEAYSSLGDVLRDQGRWAEAEKNYLKALELEPGNVTANMWYAEFLYDVGRLREARGYLVRALETDPLSPGANATRADIERLLGNNEAAMKYASAAADLGHHWGLWLMGIMHLERGEYEKALYYKQLAEDKWQLAAENRPAEKLIALAKDSSILDEVLAWADTVPTFPLEARALLLVKHGRVDEAVAAMPEEREGWANVVNWYWDKDLGPLRRHPRFKVLMQKAGLVEYWRNNTWADRCQPRGDDDFYCE